MSLSNSDQLSRVSEDKDLSSMETLNTVFEGLAMDATKHLKLSTDQHTEDEEESEDELEETQEAKCIRIIILVSFFL